MPETIDILKATVRAEAAAIGQLEAMIDQSWQAAVEVLHQTRVAGGRVIICGVGKSGHVGKKITASLASTGTPAFFVHGTEASHGDLGMIQPGDAVLMITASGGTVELVDTASYCRSREIPLILITRNPDSRVGRYANIVLRLPDVPEACTIAMAPTTSSTATLVIGDALTVALMSLVNFTKADFGLYHPGGKLGDATRRLIDVMHGASSLRSVASSTPLRAVLAEAAEHQALVIDGSHFCLNAASLIALTALATDLDTPIAALLPAGMPKAAPSSLVGEIRQSLSGCAIWGVAVVEDDKLIGYATPQLFK
jgi:arabinose-5-phosphate isomerase